MIRRRALLGGDGGQVVLGYVDGMIMLLDGIENTLTGHKTSVTTWQDLSKNGNDLILPVNNKFAVNNNNIQLIPTIQTDKTMGIAGGLKVNNNIVSSFPQFTFEIRFISDYPNLNANYIVPAQSSNVATSNNFSIYYYSAALRLQVNGAYNAQSGLTNSVLTITFVYDKNINTVSVYNTGVYFQNFNVPTDYDNVFNQELWFGNWDSTGNVATKMKIFNVRVYPFALSAQQILDNYNNDINRGLI